MKCCDASQTTSERYGATHRQDVACIRPGALCDDEVIGGIACSDEEPAGQEQSNVHVHFHIVNCHHASTDSGCQGERA